MPCIGSGWRCWWAHRACLRGGDGAVSASCLPTGCAEPTGRWCEWRPGLCEPSCSQQLLLPLCCIFIQTKNRVSLCQWRGSGQTEPHVRFCSQLQPARARWVQWADWAIFETQFRPNSSEGTWQVEENRAVNLVNNSLLETRPSAASREWGSCRGLYWLGVSACGVGGTQLSPAHEKCFGCFLYSSYIEVFFWAFRNNRRWREGRKSVWSVRQGCPVKRAGRYSSSIMWSEGQILLRAEHH